MFFFSFYQMLNDQFVDIRPAVSRQCCRLFYGSIALNLFNFYIYLQAVKSIFLAQLLEADDDHILGNWVELAVNLLVCQYVQLNSFRSQYGTENDNGTASNLQLDENEIHVKNFNSMLYNTKISVNDPALPGLSARKRSTT